MTTLITGGSKCGKSSLAESILSASPRRKIYIAAMQPFGEAAAETITRHRKMREGKGFETLELFSGYSPEQIPEGCAVMIEDIANLTANEMFTGETVRDPFGYVMRDIEAVESRAADVIIVSNTVGADGHEYSPGTADYIRAIGRINAALAEKADRVIECVFGIPIVLKGELL